MSTISHQSSRGACPRWVDRSMPRSPPPPSTCWPRCSPRQSMGPSSAGRCWQPPPTRWSSRSTRALSSRSAPLSMRCAINKPLRQSQPAAARFAMRCRTAFACWARGCSWSSRACGRPRWLLSCRPPRSTCGCITRPRQRSRRSWRVRRTWETPHGSSHTQTSCRLGYKQCSASCGRSTPTVCDCPPCTPRGRRSSSSSRTSSTRSRTPLTA
mmetsp:Transcript_5438/g.11740  ORF Transcript_5438/g.11740 Transcript_5438/m.11740 type:complete len:212 (+) Transcript_5438:779-1414(+)